MKQPQRNGTAKKDAKRGNRRERKLKKRKKELRQWIARTSNELFRRKLRRKASKIKEKEILKQLKVQKGEELTSNNLKIAKEQRLGKLRYKNAKLEKCIEKRKRKQDNQKEFFKKLEGHQTRERKCLRSRNLSNLLEVFGRKKK